MPVEPPLMTMHRYEGWNEYPPLVW